jgi:hypothetical protein
MSRHVARKTPTDESPELRALSLRITSPSRATFWTPFPTTVYTPPMTTVGWSNGSRVHPEAGSKPPMMFTPLRRSIDSKYVPAARWIGRGVIEATERAWPIVWIGWACVPGSSSLPVGET